MEETRGYQPYSTWISPSRFTVSDSLSYTHTTRNRPATKRSAFGLYVLTMLYDTSLESSSSHPMQLSQNNAYFDFRAHNSPIRQYTQSMAMARVCAAEPPIWHDVLHPLAHVAHGIEVFSTAQRKAPLASRCGRGLRVQWGAV